MFFFGQMDLLVCNEEMIGQKLYGQKVWGKVCLMIGCYVRDGINVIENLDDGCEF